MKQRKAVVEAQQRERDEARAGVETCKWQHVPCADCGAMQTFIGHGLYECWKCTAMETRIECDAAMARAEAAEAEADRASAEFADMRTERDAIVAGAAALRAALARVQHAAEKIRLNRRADDGEACVCGVCSQCLAELILADARSALAAKGGGR